MDGPISDLSALLRAIEPKLNLGVYAFVSVRDPQSLSGVEVLATVREPEGLSAVLQEPDAVALGLQACSARRGSRWRSHPTCTRSALWPQFRTR